MAPQSVARLVQYLVKRNPVAERTIDLIAMCSSSRSSQPVALARDGSGTIALSNPIQSGDDGTRPARSAGPSLLWNRDGGRTNADAKSMKTAIILAGFFISSLIATAPCQSFYQNDSGLKGFEILDGFRIAKVADDKLVHDCFTMTLDGAGRPVVSGPGYIKTLYDDNADGVYDRAVTFTTQSVAQGAHGLWCEPARFYWVSDGAIWFADDSDRNSVADTGPRKILDIATGGEHDAHSLKRGPDGYWYLMVGNFAANIGRLANDPNSPITRPRGGTLWRISPDFQSRAVWSHGMRNCYDFDFLPDGQIVTFESDCERESIFPWYRPTRVMVLGPGTDAGWCGLTWKDQDQFITMPQVLGAMGRASPTGVAVYEHSAFPARYRGAVFALDWTFGRVVALYPNRNLPPALRPGDKLPAEVLVQTTGGVGFAPTALRVAPDGSLLIAVGGRGTAGAIYRVSAESSIEESEAEQVTTSPFQDAIQSGLLTQKTSEVVLEALTAPTPWYASAVKDWAPQLDTPSRTALLRLVSGDLPLPVFDEKSSRYVPATNLPLRAAQLLTRLEVTVPIQVVDRALSRESSQHHAAAWWILGRGKVSGMSNKQETYQALSQQHPSLNELTPWEDHLGNNALRLQLEALGLRRWPLQRQLQPVVTDDEPGRVLRRTWLWSAAMNPAPLPAQKDLNALDHLFAKRLYATRVTSLDTSLLDIMGGLVPKMEAAWGRRERLEFLAALQVALGDRRLTLPQQQEPQNLNALDGYRSTYDSTLNPKVRAGWELWVTYVGKRAVSAKDEILLSECVRTLALLNPKEKTSLRWLLSLPSGSTHPTSDINVLCALARCDAPRAQDDSSSTAKILLDAFRKLNDYGLASESQWPQRAQQLVIALNQVDRNLSRSILQINGDYRASDLQLLTAFSAEVQTAARQQMVQHIVSTSADRWDAAILNHCTGFLPDQEITRSKMREAVAIPGLERIAVEWLIRRVTAADYSALLIALESDDLVTAETAWHGLKSLPQQDPNAECHSIATLAHKVSTSSTSKLSTSEIIPRLIRACQAAGKSNIPTSTQWRDWQTYLPNLLPAEIDGFNTERTDWTQVSWKDKVAKAEHLTGRPERGRALYEQRCINCHGGSTSLGPSLSGATRRFSNADLAVAIFEPSQDVSDRYRSTKILTVDDESIVGLLIEDGKNAVTVLLSDGKSRTIPKTDIEEMAPSTQSIMPSGLLDSASSQDYADLLAHLKSLQ